MKIEEVLDALASGAKLVRYQTIVDDKERLRTFLRYPDGLFTFAREVPHYIVKALHEREAIKEIPVITRFNSSLRDNKVKKINELYPYFSSMRRA